MLHLTACMVAAAPSGPPRPLIHAAGRCRRTPPGRKKRSAGGGVKLPRAPKRMVWARLVEFWHAAVNTALRHEAKSFLREAARDELVEHAARYITTARKKSAGLDQCFKMDVTIKTLKANR